MQKFILGLFAAVMVAIGGLVIYQNFFTEPTDYKTVVAQFEKVDVATVDKMHENKEAFILYVGRETCPDCREYVPGLLRLSKKHNVRIAYLDVLDIANNPQIEAYRERAGIRFVPSLVVYKADGTVIYPTDQAQPDKIEEDLALLK
ncbi:hypothetical protein NHG23_00065 [Aerococcaceae bacterium NML190073]|nr:hypothetical protein [Aerococcaceae bacterium NML190073]MCW6664724.1 hypothetical protein [Aerococcaceae bacterium NML191219]